MTYTTANQRAENGGHVSGSHPGLPVVPWEEVISPGKWEEKPNPQCGRWPATSVQGLGMCESCPVHTHLNECQPNHPDCDFEPGRHIAVNGAARKKIKRFGPPPRPKPRDYSGEGKEEFKRLMDKRGALKRMLHADGVTASGNDEYVSLTGYIYRLGTIEGRKRAQRLP